MQDSKKVIRFKKAVGKIIRNIRMNKANISINRMALEFDFDRGNLSKTERGIYGIQLITAWRIAEALGIKLSDFVLLLEKELGEDFTLIDE